jgi:AcrR family transcriptional regulator
LNKARPEGRGARTADALVAAGRALMAERPIAAIAVDDIVRAAGVAKGSFYNYFEDKDALARAIAKEVRIGVEAEVSEANARIDDPAHRVARAVCVYINHALSNPQAAGIMLRVYAGDVTEAALNQGVTHDVSDGLLKGRFAVASVEAGVLFILGVAHLALARAHAEPNPAVAVPLGQQLCSLILRGLGLTPGEADAIAAKAAHQIIRQLA